MSANIAISTGILQNEVNKSQKTLNVVNVDFELISTITGGKHLAPFVKVETLNGVHLVKMNLFFNWLVDNGYAKSYDKDLSKIEGQYAEQWFISLGEKLHQKIFIECLSQLETIFHNSSFWIDDVNQEDKEVTIYSSRIISDAQRNYIVGKLNALSFVKRVSTLQMAGIDVICKRYIKEEHLEEINKVLDYFK